MSAYCKKDCDNCQYKEEIGCFGCKNGFLGDENTCEISLCCKEKGHDECEGCNYSEGCYKLRSKEYMPQKVIDKIEREKEAEIKLKEDAVILAKYTSVLFWLVVPSMFSGFLTTEALFGGTFISTFGSAIGVFCSFIYAFSLFKLKNVKERYKTAGICCFISTIFSMFLGLVNENNAIWMLMILIPVGIISIVGTYNELTAHSEALSGVDNELSGKWSSLWSWYKISLLVMLSAIVCMIIVPVLGALALLAGLIILIVIEILQIVYMYKTQKRFKEYCEE